MLLHSFIIISSCSTERSGCAPTLYTIFSELFLESKPQIAWTPFLLNTLLKFHSLILVLRSFDILFKEFKCI